MLDVTRRSSNHCESDVYVSMRRGQFCHIDYIFVHDPQNLIQLSTHWSSMQHVAKSLSPHAPIKNVQDGVLLTVQQLEPP